MIVILGGEDDLCYFSIKDKIKKNPNKPPTPAPGVFLPASSCAFANGAGLSWGALVEGVAPAGVQERLLGGASAS